MKAISKEPMAQERLLLPVTLMLAAAKHKQLVAMRSGFFSKNIQANNLAWWSA
jgi:hypothetical protein